MSDENSFQHISVGLNQMLVNLRRRMDENKHGSVVGKPTPGRKKNVPQPSDDESENAA